MSRRIEDWNGAGTGFMITEAIAYPDTLGCLISYPLEEDFWTQLRATTLGKPIPARPRRIRTKLYQPIRVQQPTRETFAFLNDRSCVICRADISVDLICATAADATMAAAFISTFLVQKWHGKRRLNPYKHTTYLSDDRRAPRNVAIYGDKPSKTGRG